MTVLFVDHSGLPGGGQLGLRRYLEDPGTLRPVAAVLSGGSAFDGLDAGRVKQLGVGTSNWSLVRAAFRLRRLMQRIRPDVVVANSVKAATVLAMLPRVRGPVYVYYLRSDLDPTRMSSLKWWFLARIVVPRFDAYLANSRWTASTIPAKVAGRPMRVAYPVSGVRALRPSGPRPASSAQQGGPLRVLYLGRIAAWKGVDVILDAARVLDDRGVGAIFEFRVAGGSFHADADFAVLTAARAEDLRNVRFVGHQADVEPLLAWADVLVSPSVQPEPLGQVVVQGMAAGLAVIATAHGGPTELIDDGRTGLLIPPGDPLALAGALQLLAADPSLVRGLGAAASEASQRFADGATIQGLEAAIGDLNESVRASRR